MRSPILSLPLLGSLAAAQVFIPAPQDTTIVESELFEGAEVSYKKTSICETTEGVNSYSGYVKLPKDLLPDAQDWEDGTTANMFFWYFEARNDPENAPTSIYLGGGPGTSSFDGMSDFPCFFNADSNSTTLNEFSWNNNVNMLYIDQPVGTGFSYVELQNGSYSFLTGQFEPVDSEDDLPELNVTTVQATLNGGEANTVVNTTMSAARTLWVFSQVWFNEFPEWQTENDKLSLWTVSYGGFYGPAVFDYFQQQNENIDSGEQVVLPGATKINLATLGLNDACVDARAMAQGYPTFAFNNTYGLPVYDEDVYEMIMANITDTETGCYGLTDTCRALAAEGDPHSFGNNQTVNEACSAATNLCFNELQGAYQGLSDRNAFDVTHSNTTVFPEPYREAYLNQRWVQEEMGVPVNFTTSSIPVQMAFFLFTGDPMRRSLSTLENVLATEGVNVAMVYGDRDYRCNWYGGENVSLTIDFENSADFRSAGYTPITTNSSYEGGLVREHGKLSFSRIFQAGHGVAGYQPETMSQVFERAMFGKDVATGEVDLAEDTSYATEGPLTIYDFTNKVPEPVSNLCAVHSAPIACTEEQLLALFDGSAVIEGDIVVEPEGAPPAVIESTNDQDTVSEGNTSGGDDSEGSSSEPEDVTDASVRNSAGMGVVAVAMAVVMAMI